MSELEQIKFEIKGVNLPNKDDVLTITRQAGREDIWTRRGDSLPQPIVDELQAQAETFVKSKLWKVLKDDLLWQAQKRGLLEATGVSDILVGKSLVYMTNIIDTRLKEMTKQGGLSGVGTESPSS